MSCSSLSLIHSLINIQQQVIAIPDQKNGWGPIIQGAQVISLTQEHGVIRFTNAESLDQFKIGDLVIVIPVHSCLVVPLLFSFLSTSGKVISSLFSQP